MSYEYQGNVALVTASSSGLGKASAKALAGKGISVVINGRDGERLSEAVEEISTIASNSAEVVGCKADITEIEDIKRLVKRPVEEFGGLDYLVTSAGGPPRMGVFETEDYHWYDTFDLLVMSVLRCVREAKAELVKNSGGAIVNITSLVVKEANQDNPLSSSVRMATVGLSKCLSYELSPKVRVNAVLPGIFDTPRLDDGDSGYTSTPEVPIGRIGDPEEFGEVVAFLSSEQASYINGAAIPVDGGFLNSTF